MEGKYLTEGDRGEGVRRELQENGVGTNLCFPRRASKIHEVYVSHVPFTRMEKALASK
jgi:hypothetical protein